MSTNISKEKRDKLIRKIKTIRDYIAAAPQDENTGNLLTYLSEIEKDIKGKKYGLVFEEHREGIDEILATHTPVLSEDSDLFIDNGGQMNFLIEGDNLASLQLLEKTHKGKIDLIYIDPPYNTGNKDFVYNDTFINGDDEFRHSKWASFIHKRLSVTKRLLSNKGLIFISIDDNEIYSLKFICDSIFGENNYISSIVWKRKRGRDNSAKWVSKAHEYLLVYANNKENCKLNYLELDEETKKAYKNPDNDPRGIYRMLGCWARGTQGGVKYDFTTKDGKYFSERLWLFSKENLKKLDEDNKLIIRGDNIYRKMFIYENKGKIADSVWDDVSNAANASDEIKSIFNNIVFDTAKPIPYIKRIIQLASSKNSLILDFFAGSGTTGHAVMKLNAEDGGNRKFILCTNNENNICREITYERIKRVIEKDDYNASLKYYKVDYIPISDKLYYEYADELLKHIKELVELENGINFTDNNEIAILLSEDEVAAFVSDQAKFKACKKIYLGHDVLLDGNQEYILDQNKIELNIIPEYYYKELET